MAKPLVLYVVGYGRSGSTLLDRLLGSIDGFCSCGEIFELWRALNKDRLCSCGSPVKTCSFWKSVLEETFRASQTEKITYDFAHAFYSTINKRNLLNLLFPSIRSKSFQTRITEIGRVINRVYQAIADISNKKVIVDSSKYTLYAHFLLDACDLDLRLVHLIRDSRAVVYSHVRKKFVPEIGQYTATKNPFRTALAWNLHNLLAERLRARHKYVQIHYEDLAAHPKQTVFHILEALNLVEELGLDKDEIFASFKAQNKVVLNKGHLVAGNTMRFKQGEMEIKLDEEWKRALPLFYKATTSFFTAPLLKKYGYKLNWKTCGDA